MPTGLSSTSWTPSTLRQHIEMPLSYHHKDGVNYWTLHMVQPSIPTPKARGRCWCKIKTTDRRMETIMTMAMMSQYRNSGRLRMRWRERSMRTWEFGLRWIYTLRILREYTCESKSRFLTYSASPWCSTSPLFEDSLARSWCSMARRAWFPGRTICRIVLILSLLNVYSWLWSRAFDCVWLESTYSLLILILWFYLLLELSGLFKLSDRIALSLLCIGSKLGIWRVLLFDLFDHLLDFTNHMCYSHHVSFGTPQGLRVPILLHVLIVLLRCIQRSDYFVSNVCLYIYRGSRIQYHILNFCRLET